MLGKHTFILSSLSGPLSPKSACTTSLFWNADQSHVVFIAMRKLKFHEQKLLKKVDFLQWKNEHKLRELQVGWPGCCCRRTSAQQAGSATAITKHPMACALQAVLLSARLVCPMPLRQRLQDMRNNKLGAAAVAFQSKCAAAGDAAVPHPRPRRL